MSTKPIITRFAPSPTGFLHVGGLRTALYNYLFAKHHGGKFFIRIEDTDQARKIEGATENLLKIINDFGLNYDNEPMIQSQRLEIYHQHADKLLAENKAYKCFCSKEDLDQMRKIQTAKGLPPMYDSRCSKISEEEIQNCISRGESYVIRFKMDKKGNTVFTDGVRGKVQFENSILDDPIIIKSDGYPTYHLAAVIDDHEMEISHVIRGEEWLPSTPKHLQLYKALGYQAPEFAHLPLLLNPDKSKLSKRQGDVAVEDYVDKGYLKKTLLNFILLLGWNPKTDQEIFELSQMIEQFDLAKINKSGAVFNVDKLNWLNKHYIKQLSVAQFTELILPYFAKAGLSADQNFIAAAAKTEKERITKLDEIVEATSFFFELTEYNAKDLIWKKSTAKDTKKYLSELAVELNSVAEENWNETYLESKIKNYLVDKGYALGDALWPLRFALSGRKASPSPFEIAEVLGKKETVKRVDAAIKQL